jgi:thiol-disulfide isomerase/thioredoxin
MKVSKLLLGAVLVIAIGAPIAGFVGDIKLPRSSIPTGEPIAFFHGLGSTRAVSPSGLASLERADAWLNSPPLSASALRGKVILVHFWTYTCINWLRTQSYLRAWAEKYKDKGLVVIGVHTPEFRFEKNLDNVRRETKALRVDYPVAVDSEYAIWRAFDNNYWPAQYFIDAQGRVRHTHFGEGSYDHRKWSSSACR